MRIFNCQWITKSVVVFLDMTSILVSVVKYSALFLTFLWKASVLP